MRYMELCGTARQVEHDAVALEDPGSSSIKDAGGVCCLTWMAYLCRNQGSWQGITGPHLFNRPL